MKRYTPALLLGAFAALACALFVYGTIQAEFDPDRVLPETDTDPPAPTHKQEENDPLEEDVAMPRIRIQIGSQTFTATLADTEAARAWAECLPMTVTMSELNGNEKYYYMDASLPTAAQNPGSIQCGDLMLYGNNCLVLFYENFSTSYSYTALGHIDDPEGLAQAVGTGSVQVSFEIQ